MPDKESCGFGEMLKLLCDADFRHTVRFAGKVQIKILSTEPYELNVVEKELYGKDHAN